jgi:nucleotide-binding universal stress UspA family protein
MILIAYDGSPDSQAAIAHAAELFPGSQAIILTVWQQFIDTITRSGVGLGIGAVSGVDTVAIDAQSEQAAEQRAAEGAEAAKHAGLAAEARTAVVAGTVAGAILHEAGAAGASSIVLGSRGLTGVKSFLLGSVSTAVLHHAALPVVVVPSAEVAAHRSAHLAEQSS